MENHLDIEFVQGMPNSEKVKDITVTSVVSGNYNKMEYLPY